jgi:anti-sigma factor RsiW
MEDKIYREESIQAYLDGMCTNEAASEIERRIAGDKEWKKSFEEFSELHRMLQSDTGLMEPSMRFTKNVMEGISGMQVAKPASKYLNPWINRFFAGILIVFLGISLAYALMATDWSSENVNIPLKLPEVTNPLTSIDSYFGSGATLLFFAANMVLGMVLLDYRLRQKKQGMNSKSGAK